MRCDVMLKGSTGCSWLVEVLEGEQWEEVVTRTRQGHAPVSQSACPGLSLSLSLPVHFPGVERAQAARRLGSPGPRAHSGRGVEEILRDPLKLRLPARNEEAWASQNW